MIRKILFATTWLIMCIIITSCGRDNKAETAQANILFLFADDHSYTGVNALGNNEIITPNLDKLVESGVTFTHAYNMGAWHGAVCVASRAMLNTGRMLFRAKEAEDQHYNGFKEKRMFWSQMMEDKGYETYISGKWHVAEKAEDIFQTSGHIRGGMPPTVQKSYNRPLSDTDNAWLPWDTLNGGYWEGGTHWSEVVANEAIGFLQQAETSIKPFFMYIAFNAPHDPRQSPKEYVDLYSLDNIELPPSFQEEYPYKMEMGCPPTLRDEKLAPFPRTPYSVRVHTQEYYAIISHMDKQIGRIIEELKLSGQDKNTYIIFSADHGLACGKHGLMGKQSLYDHSIRVPLIIAGPDIPENEKRDMQVYLQDLMATTLEVAGIEKPEYVDFNSLLPLIKIKNSDSPYPVIFGSYRNLQRMVRSETHKLIFYPKAGVYRLYDIINDPLELNDIAAEPGNLKLIKDLAFRFKTQQTIVGDTLKLAAYYPDLF